MLKASFDQEYTFKANVLISFCSVLVCSVEQPGGAETGVLLGKTKTKNICQELIDCAVTIARLSVQATGFVVGRVCPSQRDFNRIAFCVECNERFRKQ